MQYFGALETDEAASQARDGPAFRFANFEIDVARQELRRAGDLIPVEPQVFDLLVHLIRNRNRIVSRDELIDAVWKGRVISEATLSSRVSAVRRVIGDNGTDQTLIRTHHKRGFRFVGLVDDAKRAREMLAANSVQQKSVIEDLKSQTQNSAALRAALTLPDKPSIAVLPFQNRSGDSVQEYFADGLTEDIITGLSRQRWFFVIARNSSFAFKADASDARKVAGELGVRYVLEGSVRKASGRVRVTAQLVDASKGVNLWAERYDRDLANIFELQDEITNRVIDSVGSQIIVAEAARVQRKSPQNIEAWDLVMQALPHMWRMTVDEQRVAQDLLQQAVGLDSDYAHAHALLGWTHLCMFNLNTRMPIGEFTEKALACGWRALALDEQDHWGHLVVGLGYTRRRRPDPAVMHLSKALELNPNFALGYAGLGYAYACGGQPERGLESLEQAQRLSPCDPFLAIYAPVARYMALFGMKKYEETIAVCRAYAALHPHHAGAWRLMTTSLGLLGKIDEAKEALARTLTLQPDLSSAHVANNTVFANPDDRARFLLGLQKAGLRD
ncbi:MAG TPA: winged helix-turn-helix domain-containing tetratricopeptide repeat protein [Pseudolabrys sp.]|nr:winged helix-turn-helix domain-containing tetratricopeptide repeat protein [Pseudolabrys sp.]